MRDKLVFDIETKNTFQDVGGKDRTDLLNVSVVGVYSYNRNEYRCFDEYELKELGEWFKNAYLIIGFYSKNFDVPVMEKYYDFKLTSIPHIDILEEIQNRLSRRIGLGVLAEANLGVGKSGHGLDAIEYYKNGEIEKLKAYCLQDVKVTKEIYDMMLTKKHLWIPSKFSSEMTKLDFSDFKEPTPPPSGLF
jgi:DEAD/DEAH box helicase domain-containing protein